MVARLMSELNLLLSPFAITYQAELSLNLLAVQLAALKALHSLLSNFLSSFNHESSSSREVNQESASTSTAASPSLSTPPKELLVSLLDAVEQFSKDLLPDRSSQTGRQSQQQSSESSLQSPIESERDSLNHQAKQEVSLARLNNLLENLSSINLPNSSQPLASSSDIQLSSTLGALVKSLDRVRKETNKHLVKTTGDSEESEGEESGSGSGGSFSAPGSAGLSEGLDPTSPLSPQSLVDSPGTGGSPSLLQRSNDLHQHHSGSTPQASTSTSSLPLTTTSHESLSRQRRGSFPTTTTAMINNYQTNFIEEQLRDPFAETLDTHQQHQEPDVFSTLHKLMANLSGRTLPATLGTEKEKAFQQQQDTELGSSTDSQLVPASPSLSEPFGDHKKISSPNPNSSTSLDSISQASHLLAITRELVAARRAIHSSTSRSSYGYGFSSSSLRSRSAGASSASLASQNPSISGGMMNAGSQSQEGELQSTRGDLSNMGRLSRTSSGSGRSERGGETSTTGTLQRKSDSPSLSGAILGNQSPSIANNLRGSLPPRYEDEDGGVESRSVDTHGSLRSSLIGSQSTTLPAYAGLGIASSEKGEKNEKEKDRNSISSSTRSPNASSTAIQTPPSILRNPLPSGSNVTTTSSGEKEWERARSPSGRSEYAARTSADLSLVQSSIERLYNAVPQLADQRVAPPARLTSVINKNNSLASTSTGTQQVSQSPIMDINIEELVMRMGKRGRMEDQRADLSLKLKNPNSSASPNNVSPTFFKEKEEEDLQSRERSTSSSGNNTGHQSRFSVGSLSGGLGSLRKIGGKGKAKEDSSSLSNNISNNHKIGGGDEIVQITSSQSSSFNSPQISPGIDQTFDDVRRTTGKKNKLEKMGISTGSASGMEVSFILESNRRSLFVNDV